MVRGFDCSSVSCAFVRSLSKVDDTRELLISQIEKAALEFVVSGETEKWFDGADAKVKEVAHGVNGPLLSMLAKACGYSDLDAVELFRRGGPLVGELHRSGNGRPIDEEPQCSVQEMADNCAARNMRLIESLKEDVHSAILFNNTCEDLENKRFHTMVDVDEADLSMISVAKRFGIEQGRRCLILLHMHIALLDVCFRCEGGWIDKGSCC